MSENKALFDSIAVFAAKAEPTSADIDRYLRALPRLRSILGVHHSIAEMASMGEDVDHLVTCRAEIRDGLNEAYPVYILHVDGRLVSCLTGSRGVQETTSDVVYPILDAPRLHPEFDAGDAFADAPAGCDEADPDTTTVIPVIGTSRVPVSGQGRCVALS